MNDKIKALEIQKRLNELDIIHDVDIWVDRNSRTWRLAVYFHSPDFRDVVKYAETLGLEIDGESDDYPNNLFRLDFSFQKRKTE